MAASVVSIRKLTGRSLEGLSGPVSLFLILFNLLLLRLLIFLRACRESIGSGFLRFGNLLSRISRRSQLPDQLAGRLSVCFRYLPGIYSLTCRKH